MAKDKDSFNDFLDKGNDDLSDLIEKIAAHKDIIDSSELDKDLEDLFVKCESEKSQYTPDEKENPENHFFEKIEKLAQELHKATLDTDKRLNKIEDEIKEQQIPEFAKLCEDLELDYFLSQDSEPLEDSLKVDKETAVAEIEKSISVQQKPDLISVKTTADEKIKSGLAGIVFFIDNFIYLLTRKSIFARFTENHCKQQLLRLDNNLVGLDFASFATRPHDSMGIEIAAEKHRDRDSLIKMVSMGLGAWIIIMLITGIIQMPDKNFVLESFSEWELRMSNDPLLNELFNSQNHRNYLSEQSQSSASLITSQNSGQQVAGARVGISGGGGETGVYRALRILSAGTNSYLGSGDASIQDLLENPGQVSITAPRGVNNGSIGSNQVMQTVHSDTVALSSAQGGELSHQARVEISPSQSLSGEPEALIYRDNSSINRVLVRHRGAIQYLYNSYRENNPYLSGQVVMNLIIDSHGQVLSTTVVSSDMGAPDFVNQLRTMVMMWQFTPLEDTTLSPVTVTIPFNFIDF